mgnify:CR=1 FL=1
MPFCTQCGNQVSNADMYCPRCGCLQPDADPRVNRRTSVADGIDDRTWSTLCYVPTLGFHAFQGLYLFVAALILDWGGDPLFGPLFGLSGRFPFNPAKLFHLALFGIGIFMMIKTYTGHHLRLPVFGELADKSLADHR